MACLILLNKYNELTYNFPSIRSFCIKFIIISFIFFSSFVTYEFIYGSKLSLIIPMTLNRRYLGFVFGSFRFGGRIFFSAYLLCISSITFISKKLLFFLSASLMGYSDIKYSFKLFSKDIVVFNTLTKISTSMFLLLLHSSLRFHSTVI